MWGVAERWRWVLGGSEVFFTAEVAVAAVGAGWRWVFGGSEVFFTAGVVVAAVGGGCGVWRRGGVGYWVGRRCF